jgi:hypothetical protein
VTRRRQSAATTGCPVREALAVYSTCSKGCMYMHMEGDYLKKEDTRASSGSPHICLPYTALLDFMFIALNTRLITTSGNAFH